ncbi:MAG TPA: hypothetical protein VGT80_04280 [Phenylobacterium sp.]|nr:hypothetical protein [Phenylobacterium sp.]
MSFGAVAPMSTCEIAALLMLQLLSEVHAALSPDSEGGEVLGRAREMLADWETLGRIVVAPGTPFEPGAGRAIGELRDLLDRSAPLMARIRRTPMPPPGPAGA